MGFFMLRDGGRQIITIIDIGRALTFQTIKVYQLVQE